MATSIIEMLKREIEAYKGPLPANGNSPEELWLRQAFRNLLDLEQQSTAPSSPQPCQRPAFPYPSLQIPKYRRSSPFF